MTVRYIAFSGEKVNYGSFHLLLVQISAGFLWNWDYSETEYTHLIRGRIYKCVIHVSQLFSSKSTCGSNVRKKNKLLVRISLYTYKAASSAEHTFYFKLLQNRMKKHHPTRVLFRRQPPDCLLWNVFLSQPTAPQTFNASTFATALQSVHTTKQNYDFLSQVPIKWLYFHEGTYENKISLNLQKTSALLRITYYS